MNYELRIVSNYELRITNYELYVERTNKTMQKKEDMHVNS